MAVDSEHCVTCGIHPGEHHQARQASRIGTGDIGVEPVTYHERRAKVPTRQRILHQCRCRLSCHQGFSVSGCP